MATAVPELPSSLLKDSVCFLPIQMKAYVDYAGRSRPLVLKHDPALPLKDFKAKFRFLEGTRRPIVLFHRGKDIMGGDDDSTLDQCGIHDGTRLSMGYRLPFPVRLQCVDFEYTILVGCFDTIHSLKQKIERRTGILVEEQELECNGVALSESERTLLSYGVYKAKLDRFICDFTIHLCHTTKQYFADIAAEIYKNDFSNMQLTNISVSAAKIQVHVKTGYFSEPLTLDLDPALHLSTLKHALQNKYGSRSDQILLYSNGKNLFEENSTLEQCGIKSGITLLLGYTGCFLVKYLASGAYGLVEIDCSDTVGRLEQAIAKATGIPEYDQALSCIGVNLFDPGRTLLSHGIFRKKIGTEEFFVDIDRRGYFEVDQPKRIFHHSYSDFYAEACRRGVHVDQVIKERNVDVCIIIPLKNDPSAVHIVFEIPVIKEKKLFRFMPNETVDNVKSVIRQRSARKFKALRDVSYISNGEFELEFQGQRLDDNSKTLDSLGIKSGSTVQLYDSKPFGVVLELDNQVRCILDVHRWWTINDLKKVVFSETHVSPNEQVLYFEGQCLDNDDCRLLDYNFLNLTDRTKGGRGATVHLATSNVTSPFKEDARFLKQRRVEAAFHLHN